MCVQDEFQTNVGYLLIFGCLFEYEWNEKGNDQEMISSSSCLFRQLSEIESVCLNTVSFFAMDKDIDSITEDDSDESREMDSQYSSVLGSIDTGDVEAVENDTLD